MLAEVVETPLKKTQDLLLRTGSVASFLKNPYSTTPLSPYLPILRLFRFIEYLIAACRAAILHEFVIDLPEDTIPSSVLGIKDEEE